MRVSVVLLGLVDLSSAWTLCRLSVATRLKSSGARGRGGLLAAREFDLHEFDHLLHEEGDWQQPPTTRRVIKLEGRSDGHQRAVVLTSSTAAVPLSQEDEVYDPYAEVDFEQQVGKIQTMDQSPSMEDRFKQMDFQDVVITLVIPAIVTFVGLRWGFNKVANRVSDKTDTLLNSFANEMIHHDGNFEEMRMCHADYSRQLLWMGPRKGDAMIKRYLQAYGKRKTISPQSIASLSYVFTLFKLSEDRAAQILVSLCYEIGTDNVSSAGKIFFFGSRILKSPEGKAGLLPIRDMIKSTYRDATVADTLVDTSQKAMGEAAYRTTVLAAGKKQKTLTVGWEVLALDKDTATRVFEEEAKEGFITDREKFYGNQSQKYDKKGNAIDKDKDSEDNTAEKEEDDEGAKGTSNVYECGECGFTLFIAQGRESKFYGDDFKCPECGAQKDKFRPGNIES